MEEPHSLSKNKKIYHIPLFIVYEIYGFPLVQIQSHHLNLRWEAIPHWEQMVIPLSGGKPI